MKGSMSFVNNEATANGGENIPRYYLYNTVVFVALNEVDVYASGFVVQLYRPNARERIANATSG